MPELTHFKDGKPKMVDVSTKLPTLRVAVAEVFVRLTAEAREALNAGGGGKGDPLSVAQLAGIMGAKRTSELIPLCHPLPITGVDLQLDREDEGVRIRATVRTKAETGVEMEALTACAVAALTVYDMLKAASKGLEITDLRLLEKSGGKSGEWRRRDTVTNK